MRDHEHDAAVEQRQPRDGKPWVLAHFVRAVAIDHRRRRQLEAGAVDDRQRNPGAVRSDRPIPPLDVILATVVAEHGLFAQQCPAPGGQLEVIHPHRRQKRRRPDPHHRGIPVRVGAEPRRHQRRVERDLLRLAVGAVGSRWATPESVAAPRSGSSPRDGSRTHPHRQCAHRRGARSASAGPTDCPLALRPT